MSEVLGNFLATYLLHSTVILGLTLLLLRLPTLRAAAVRDVALRVALVAGLFTAAFSPVQRQPIALAAPVPAAQILQAQASEARHGSLEVTAPATAIPPTRPPLNPLELLTLGTLSFAALRVIFAWAMIRRARGRRVDDPGIRTSLQRLIARDGRGESVEVFWTRLPLPCAFGPRTILLPYDIRQRLSAAEVDAVVAHEYAHLLRNDPLWNLALSLLSLLLWFQPLNGLALGLWRDATEERCDAWAARHAPRLTLAQAIVTLARQPHIHRIPALLTSQAARHTSLSGRIHALLTPQEFRMKRSNLLALSLLPVLLGAVTPSLAFSQAPVTVVLDAAHGWPDPGAVGFANEAELVLVLARKVRTQLEKSGVTVIMTRDSDDQVSLEDRIKLIPANAVAYISIHLNASENPADRGPETYIASPEVNRNFAKSQVLGRNLQAAMLTASRSNGKVAVLTDGNFYVLRNSPVPAAMIEAGYVTNDADARALQHSAYQDRLAAAIAGAVLKGVADPLR